MAEDNTGRAALARHDRASRRLRTQVRTYVLRRDLRGARDRIGKEVIRHR